MRQRFEPPPRARGVMAALALTLLGVASGPAQAQTAESEDPGASAGNIAKGVVGGAMLGAEVVMLGESAFRLRPGWLYLVGGGAGALAGGYVGHQLSDDSSNRPPSFLLAGGIALIIPTIMGVLTATQYGLPESYRSEPARDDEPEEEPGELDGLDEEPEARAPFSLQLPEVGVAQAFSRDERARYRLQQVTELHLSLLRGTF